MALLFGLFFREGVDHQARDLLLRATIVAEWSQDFDHICAVIDAIDQILLVLSFNQLG